MYPAKSGSPETTITGILTDSSTSVAVAELSCFPAVGDEGGNLATLYNDSGVWETCLYTSKTSASGNGYLTIERSGAAHASSSGGAIEWPSGSTIVRNPTGYDSEAFRLNIIDHESRLTNLTAAQINLHGITEETTIADDDEILIYDTSASANRRMSRTNFVKGIKDSYAIGVLWNRASSSPTLQRIDENGDILTLSASDFNSHPLWGGIKRCTLNAGGAATYGTNNRGDGLTLTNDYVMTEIPLAYAGAYREGDYQGILLSDEAFSSKYVTAERHPAFWKRDRSGTRVDKMYLGSYEAGASGGTTTANGTSNTIYATNRTGLKLTSKSGVKCLTGNGTDGTMAQMEVSANAIGTGWGISSYWSHALLQALLYIEYASFDSQTAVGPGRTNAANTSALDTGSGNALMDTYGTGGGTDQQAVCYRGIENPWGNLWKFLIGLNAVDTGINVMKTDGTGTLADVLTDYESTSGYIPLNGSTNIGGGTDAGAYTHGYVKDLVFADPLKLGFFPSVLGGSESTYLADYYYSHQDTLTNILLAGGHWPYAGKAGVGSLYSTSAASYVDAQFGARLEFMG
jgi:hypothetical protein